MKKIFLTLSLALLGFSGAQAYDTRVDVSRLAVDESRTYRGDRDGRDWDRHDSRAADDLDRLNREVRQVRVMIGDSRGVGQRIRDRYHRVLVATDNLNALFRRGSIRGWEVRRRAEDIRVDLERIRRELRERSGGRGGWR